MSRQKCIYFKLIWWDGLRVAWKNTVGSGSRGKKVLIEPIKYHASSVLFIGLTY